MKNSLCLLVLLAGFVLLAPSAVLAQSDQQDSNLQSEVLRLVRQLDDDRAEQREAAEVALVDLGPEAMEFFPPITPRTAAEVKERLGRVRTALELVIAQRAAQPSRVTLKGELSLEEALQAVQRQTGNRVVGFQGRGGSVSVDFEDTPFWQALDELLDQTGMKVNAYGGESNALVLMARPDEELSPAEGAVYAGVFRFEATRLESRRDLRNPAINGLRLTVTVSWEPRVRPISLQQRLDNIQALDDRGQALAIDQGRGSLNASADSGVAAIELVIPIALPQRNASRIASLKGTLNALVPGSVEPFEFTDLGNARDVENRKAGVVVTFERLRRNLDLYEVRMRVRYENAANSLESHRGWIFNNEAYVLAADGQRIDNAGFRLTRQDADEVGVAYVYPLPDGPEGCTFVYKTPATILQLPVDYELKDIELP